MKKLKQITALIGVILLIALYVSTLVLALIGGEKMQNVLFAAIICTVIVPVLLWAYSFIYRLLKQHYSEDARSQASSESSGKHTSEEKEEEP